MPAPKAGVLERIAHKDGDDVKIGAVIGIIKEGAGREGGVKEGAGKEGAGKESAAKESAGKTGGAREDAAISSGPSAPAAPASKATASSAKTAPATPSARKLAREQNVEIGAVKADGPRVTRNDVEKAAAPAPASDVSAPPPAPPATARPATPAAPRSAPSEQPRSPGPVQKPDGRPEDRVRMSKRRATIARRLVEVQQTAAMLTTFNEVDMSAVMELRARQKEAFKAKHGVGLGVASFFVKAAVAALKEFPRLNAEIQGDEMVLKHYYDIGVAVGAAEGLVVPVLRNADRMAFAEIELGIRAFARRAMTAR